MLKASAVHRNQQTTKGSVFLRTLGREGVELLGGRKSIYSTPQRPRGVEKGARGSADDIPLTSATFDGYESAFNIDNERIQKVEPLT